MSPPLKLQANNVPLGARASMGAISVASSLSAASLPSVEGEHKPLRAREARRVELFGYFLKAGRKAPGSCRCSKLSNLFNHLVGALLEKERYVQAKSFGSRKIDDELKFARLLDWQIGRFSAAQDLIDVVASAPERGRLL